VLFQFRKLQFKFSSVTVISFQFLISVFQIISMAEPKRKSNLMHFSLKIWHLVAPIFHFPRLFPNFSKKYFPWPLKFPEFFQFSLTCRNPGYNGYVNKHLSLWLIGTVRAAAWNGYQPVLGSIPRPGRINCFRITGVHALRLISRTGKTVWRCPL